MPPDAIRRLDALLRIGLKLAGAARSGRILLARIADAIELEWIPTPWGDEIVAELRRASASACQPIPWDTVERTLTGSWGAPISDELDDLEHEPAAITSSSQVHRGTIDGSPVAVKVLRPGLASSVRQDLVLLESLLAPLAAAFPALDAAATIAEVRERILEELDLEHEAGMQRRFARALARHPFLTVPAPVTDLCHEQVLVSEWVEGVPFTEAPDPDQAAARLIVFVAGGLRAGLAYAAPLPQDVRVLEDGRLAVLDFGATRTVDSGRAELVAAAVDAFAEDDGPGLGEALEKLGHGPAELGPTALHVVTHGLGELGGADPSRLDSAAVIAARDRLLSEPEPLAELIARGKLPPEDLWPMRGLAQLFATIARAGATGAWPELLRGALREGWG